MVEMAEVRDHPFMIGCNFIQSFSPDPLRRIRFLAALLSLLSAP